MWKSNWNAFGRFRCLLETCYFPISDYYYVMITPTVEQLNGSTFLEYQKYSFMWQILAAYQHICTNEPGRHLEACDIDFCYSYMYYNRGEIVAFVVKHVDCESIFCAKNCWFCSAKKILQMRLVNQYRTASCFCWLHLQYSAAFRRWHFWFFCNPSFKLYSLDMWYLLPRKPTQFCTRKTNHLIIEG